MQQADAGLQVAAFLRMSVIPQVGKVFPDLRATVQHLHENRRLWNEMYLANIEADTFKTPAEKIAEKVKLFSCCKSMPTADLDKLVDTAGPDESPEFKIMPLFLSTCLSHGVTVR
jgi:hypothetical protein